jgi:hypothetical protein
MISPLTPEMVAAAADTASFLRTEAKACKANDNGIWELLDEAADAIDNLNAALAAAQAGAPSPTQLEMILHALDDAAKYHHHLAQLPINREHGGDELARRIEKEYLDLAATLHALRPPKCGMPVRRQEQSHSAMSTGSRKPKVSNMEPAEVLELIIRRARDRLRDEPTGVGSFERNRTIMTALDLIVEVTHEYNLEHR